LSENDSIWPSPRKRGPGDVRTKTLDSRFRGNDVVVAAFALGFAVFAAQAEPVRIVAAESVYGDIARRIGGANVSVVSILARADQDPHEFEASAATARTIADAKLVVYNGAGYDPWLPRLLSATKSGSRDVIEVASLVGKKPGDNPHLWYDVRAVSALATMLGTKLAQIDPTHADDYRRGVAAFEAAMRPLRERIAGFRAKYAGVPVTATEPVFEYMADALGLAMRNARFQLAVMNGTEPSATTIAAFEKDLRGHAVKALLYNTQTGQTLAGRMLTIAAESGIPVVKITESQPAGKTYVEWMLAQLEALDSALRGR
jgi:zinc/manganese transport system substrate-binding protein